MQIIYKGVTSSQLYKFMNGVVPASLIGSNGVFLAIGNYNNETVIMANTDGSVARGVASGPPPGASTMPSGNTSGVDIYHAYTNPSLWEQS